MAQLNDKVERYEKCELPTELVRSNFDVALIENTAESVALFAGDMLIEGFAEKDSLYEICNFVTKKLATKMGGHWLCTIWPFDLEVGLGINDFSSYLALDFKSNGIDYRVIVAKTSLDAPNFFSRN